MVGFYCFAATIIGIFIYLILLQRSADSEQENIERKRRLRFRY
jgi:hypothetical protein